ncbi:MAG: peptidase domain-containing ABC transporter [Prevotellaceae bacterium]|jgi:ATP-binding cassette subfamily B protein|nr:peptidase domain-containing ABC transporter [Prevotellaceae bacterium]
MNSFPTYQQLDAMDCGATCLRIIAKYYGKSFAAATLRERCHTTREGVSMLGISDAAESMGLRTAGVKITFEQLCGEAPLPCIVHWNQKHFVVVYKIKKSKKNDNDTVIYVSDPASGLLEYKKDAFLKCWLSAVDEQAQKCGTALLFEPTPQFYREEGDEDKSGLRFAYLLKYLRPYKRYLVQLALGMLTGSVISLIFPFLTQSVVDIGIGTNNLNFIVVILVAQVMLTIGQTANSLIRSWLMLHMTTRVSISLISDFLGKLMRLPIAFFDSRMVGDIMQRIGDYNRIQSFLTGSLLSIVMALLTFIIYGCVMAGYNFGILGIFLAGSVLYVLWILLFMKRRRKLDYMRFQEAAANQSNIVQLISGMQEIKLNNCEKQKRWEWERIQAKLYKISIKGLSLQQTQTLGGLFIDQTKNVFISFLAASAVINGSMTLGMMTAMQYIIGQLNAPLSQFISFVQATQDAKISLERLNEIHAKDDEEPAGMEKIRSIPENTDIEFRNVVFQYDGPHSEKVLDNINLKIPANKVTAIVGTSGSGKTTLLKLILGFYNPVEGDVLLGGKALSKFSDSCWRRQCGVVMQEGYIFSDTIANNIAVSDEIADMQRIKKAVEIANIGRFIADLPLGYNTKIGMDGHGLSTGQKQRLLIARAAYKNAKYLIFDEATNSLDANNEKFIMEKLKYLFEGKTVIIVAHRLSTVKDADNIIVLDKGVIAEEGTHRELVAKKGNYYNLVKNQLELGS